MIDTYHSVPIKLLKRHNVRRGTVAMAANRRFDTHGDDSCQAERWNSVLSREGENSRVFLWHDIQREDELYLIKLMREKGWNLSNRGTNRASSNSPFPWTGYALCDPKTGWGYVGITKQLVIVWEHQDLGSSQEARARRTSKVTAAYARAEHAVLG